MAQGNHFLNIPKQEGFFMTIKSGRAGESRDDSPVEDEDEEETEEDVRLIPRCSPVPRKRGSSIADETAEYMRIRFALPQRRVSFADAAGNELVDVREFAAFDSDDEGDNWEEEEAECRKAYLQPVYRLWPEFQAPAGNDLSLAVRANKVEVEKVTAAEDEPLAFDALICVLNVSYHKRVYVRSTMDGWITHSDTSAEYVQDAHDGDTDKFSVRLSFAEPYVFNGARIDFVVRYETSDGEFWANNSGRNYSVTLVISYEEETAPVNKVDEKEIRGILKPSRYRAEDDADFNSDTDNGHEPNTESVGSAEMSSPVCPLVIEPEIDIEIPAFITKETQTLAGYPLLTANRQDEHLDTKQGTELLIPTNVIVDLRTDAQESDSHFTHYATSSRTFCPNKERPQSAGLPSIQVVGEDDSKDFKDLRETKREPQVSSSESSLQAPQESLHELPTARASHSTGKSHAFQNPEMQTMKQNTVTRKETSGKEQANRREKEVADASCMRHPFEPTELGQNREESRMQTVTHHPRIPDPVTQSQEQGRVAEPESNQVPDLHSVIGDTSYGCTAAGSEEKSSVLASFSTAPASSQHLSTNEQAVTLEGGNGQPTATHVKPLPKDKISLQKPAGLEIQPALPCKTSEAPGGIFNTLIPAIAVLSAIACFIVGFHEPNLFLIMALFLLLLCF